MNTREPVTRPTVWGTAILLGYLWLLLLNQLRVDWAIYPEYAYGWSVPLLGIYLFWRRWRSRPPAVSVHHHRRRRVLLGLATVLLLTVLPIRLLQEANSDWRLMAWINGVVVVGLTLLAVWIAGGRAWLRHFVFPTLFVLIAVPWPRTLELALTEFLMPSVASLTVEGLFLSGIPALQHGNLIEVATGLVGIDEACSGIRSLQATLMASLFLGELYRMTRPRRFFLLLVGVCIAFVLNAARAFFLAYIAAKEGLKAIEKWHDPAGFTILALTMIGLFVVATLLFKARPARPSTSAGAAPHWVSNRIIAGAMVWLIAIEVGVEWWFRSHEKKAAVAPGWSVVWPVSRRGFRVQPIGTPVRDTLKYDEGSSVTWMEPDGTRWSGFYFKWADANPGLKGVKYHKPDVCLPATGRTLEADLGMRLIRTADVIMPCRIYRFRDSGRPLHAFYCLTEDGVDYQSPGFFVEDTSRITRMRRVAAGKRFNRSQQVLELIVQGIESTEQATAAFERIVGDCISLERNPGGSKKESDARVN